MSNNAITMLKTMDSLLANSSNWCKGERSLDAAGVRVDALDERAVTFCLNGAMERAMDTMKDHSLVTALKVRSQIIKHTNLHWTMQGYNDAPATTFEDVKRVLALAIDDLTPKTQLRLIDVARRVHLA